LPNNGGEPDVKNAVAVGGTTSSLLLISLEPYPVSDKKIKPDEYRAKVKILDTVAN